ncbi:MAG: glycosyltransferase [Pyrinomonadaceae bacterium]
MSENLPFFSVIVPTYERPAQLRSCLRALTQVDYPKEKFEVILVDDGGTMSLENSVEQFRQGIDLRLFRQANAGPAAARNFGATHAAGEFLVFTDDDCMPASGWLRALAHQFAATPDRIVGGRTLNALPANLCSETSQLIIDVVYAHFNVRHDEATFFASNNFAMPAKRFREMQGFDETFMTSEDREICDRWRASRLGLTYAPDAHVYHAHHLTLRTLWRQHFAYGRGAYRFHRARAERQERFEPHFDFYLKLLKSAQSQPRVTRPIQLTALLLWSQIANAAGFVCEMSRRKRKGIKTQGDLAEI